MAHLNLTPARDSTSLASSSTSTSNANTNSYVYDVFINHRGPDVKKGIASHIYRRLNVHGLKVFLDQQELQEGENMTPQIEGAIRTASIHVAIFSARYAESSWCLNELLLMLESRSTIIPVFYNVNPSELRWTGGGDGVFAQAMNILLCILMCTWRENGVYDRALRMLQKKTTFDSQANIQKPRYEADTIEKWRKALFVVSQISGFELSAYNGDEGLLVDKVVQQVLKKVCKTPLNVAKYPTGLEDKVKDVEATVLSQQLGRKVRVVGIVGLGGVGKTTVAKEFFNRHRANYDRSCFVSDVRENAAKSSLNSLQTTLLNDLVHLNEQINNVHQGIEKLKHHLSSSIPSLIVLDDVDHIDQLDALFLPVKDTIHSSSLILVTSRNNDVLTSSGISESFIYKHTGLNRQHSQELFCLHAFDQPYPDPAFEQLIEKFLDACNGLPLSLKVIGELIRGKDLAYSKLQLLKISKIIPEDIRSRLKVSYDNLDEEEKHIFLDIACFFIGQYRDTAIRIWEGSGWEGSLGLRTIENKCLVEVDSKNRIRMHDHLRDLGRDLAEKEHPGCQLRFWRLTDNLLHNVSYQSPVRGINMVRGNGPEQPLENLAGIPLLTNISWLQLGYAGITAPLELRELDIDANLLEIPESIGKLKHLEKFVLHWNKGEFDWVPVDLETLPNEFYHIHSLKHMELKNCKKMMLLPNSIGNLTNLQRIDLGGCSNLQMLPDTFGNLTNLQSIFLGRCSTLQMLPDSVGNLTNLQSIDLRGCSTLEMLPYSVGNLTNLQSIDLSRCSTLQMLPYSIGNLTNLQSIDLSRCSTLQMLPESVGNLTNLQRIYLSRCFTLQMLPDSVGNLTNLQSIDLSRCSTLQMLPDSVRNLRNLQSIRLHRCSALQMLPDSIGNLMNLQNIDLSRCLTLQMLPDSVGNLMNLQSIHLRRCSSLQMLPHSIGNLTNLQSINLGWCRILQMLPDSIGNLTNLQSIHLHGCSTLQVLPDSVWNLTNLQSIDLSCCSTLQMLPDSVGNLTNLQVINLSGCSTLKMLPDSLGLLKNLQSIYLGWCPTLHSLPNSAGNLTNLQSIDLAFSNLHMLPDSIGNLTNLQSIYLGDCSNLQRLPDSVGNLTNLQSIDLSRCSTLHML